tara:strand:- start:56 stop:199 length:144 start_codon:yes stop_codon:yes gene_type:complete
MPSVVCLAAAVAAAASLRFQAFQQEAQVFQVSAAVIQPMGITIVVAH